MADGPPVRGFKGQKALFDAWSARHPHATKREKTCAFFAARHAYAMHADQGKDMALMAAAATLGVAVPPKKKREQKPRAAKRAPSEAEAKEMLEQVYEPPPPRAAPPAQEAAPIKLPAYVARYFHADDLALSDSLLQYMKEVDLDNLTAEDVNEVEREASWEELKKVLALEFVRTKAAEGKLAAKPGHRGKHRLPGALLDVFYEAVPRYTQRERRSVIKQFVQALAEERPELAPILFPEVAALEYFILEQNEIGGGRRKK